MILNIINNRYGYEMEKLTMAFFPDRKIRQINDAEVDENNLPEGETELISVELKGEGEFREAEVVYADCDSGVRIAETEQGDAATDMELGAGRALYRALSKATGLKPAWGILTGVRPSKVMTNHLNADGKTGAFKFFRDTLLVTPEKTELAYNVSVAEEPIIKSSGPDSYSLYVSIPFCPNRCSYCSFVSHSIASAGAKNLFPEYFEKLLEEVKETGRIAREADLKLESIYIGGGTPSTLSAEQIRRLLSCINENFEVKEGTEFTFEAGRADTITADKLRAIKEGGADRISINPQTMTDDILKSIGRSHTAQDVIDIFHVARETGFDNINMDLIAGLPGDTPENFERSLKDVIALSPESITVHTLAYKRSSSLVPTTELFARGKETAQMVDASNSNLYASGYEPYYMYRQTRSVGNLENVGWTKPGYKSYYNVYMMEECHSILACGAGAVTKLKRFDSPDIKRVFNYKFPYEYVNRFEELMSHKKEIISFYNTEV